jgi:hypothetical protein
MGFVLSTRGREWEEAGDILGHYCCATMEILRPAEHVLAGVDALTFRTGSNRRAGLGGGVLDSKIRPSNVSVIATEKSLNPDKKVRPTNTHGGKGFIVCHEQTTIRKAEIRCQITSFS